MATGANIQNMMVKKLTVVRGWFAVATGARQTTVGREKISAKWGKLGG